ncbi:MAG: metallophosphoesterase family protein [Gemmatimonadetes bacterium]|nr:metallophosphoesterase family protein [Gemmatimonadota bacterium]MYH17695.1 metallophosphoesterase family protein [Gemmatimonadota bacterium]
MKIAVFADVHSNLDALETVLDHIDRWRPDRVLCAGDIINRGPKPRECTERVVTRAMAEDWGLIYGNHERYVLKYGRGNLPDLGPEFEIIRHAKWTYDQLAGQASQSGQAGLDRSDCLVERLEALSFQWSMTDEAGNEFRMVHASMLGDRKGIFPDDTEASLREKIAPAPKVLVVGHTHRPLIRTVDDALVVNVGAVGAPFDRDPRAAYAQMTFEAGAWKAEIIRLDYDRERAITRFHESGYLEDSGDFARLILAEFREARSLIPGWYREYEDRVMGGEIPLKASVDRYLEDCRIDG